MRLAWRLRQFVWTLLWAVATAAHMRPKRVPVPRREDALALVAAPQRHPGFRARRLVSPAALPCAEKSLFESLSVRVLHLLQDVYPVISSHQPRAQPGAVARMREAYPAAYRLVRRPPTWHPDLEAAQGEGRLLSALAVGGPFAKLLERAEAGAAAPYKIDLGFMDRYPVRDGLARLGCRIDFAAEDGRLAVAGIAAGGRYATPDAAGWQLAERLALCSMVTHVTVWRHGMQYHNAGFAPVVVATHNLPPDNPIRRLLAPHVFLTAAANYHTHLTLRRNGFDVTGLSFPRDAIFRYYDDGAESFDLARHDVRRDIERRGIGAELDYPWRAQSLRYYGLVEDYVRGYVEHHYPSEDLLRADAQANHWFDTLERQLNGGVRSYAGTLGRDALTRFLALFIYAVSVEHEENTLWHYAVFLPTCVHQDGEEQTVGEVQSVMDFQMLISTQTNYLACDHAHLALDPAAAELMRGFRRRLVELQEQMASEPDRYWRLLPGDLKASVSA